MNGIIKLLFLPGFFFIALFVSCSKLGPTQPQVPFTTWIDTTYYLMGWYDTTRIIAIRNIEKDYRYYRDDIVLLNYKMGAIDSIIAIGTDFVIIQYGEDGYPFGQYFNYFEAVGKVEYLPKYNIYVQRRPWNKLSSYYIFDSQRHLIDTFKIRPL